MIRSTVLAALAAIIALPSLAGGQSTPREIGRISGAADDPRAELVRASWPILTDDGRFVVVNLDPLEVRVYDRRGQFQRALGREGEGPGEYRASVSLVAWPGDSVLVHSTATRRMSLFRLDGRLVREWSASTAEAPQERVAVRGNVVFKAGGVNGVRGCGLSLVEASVPRAAPLSEAITDGHGRLWVRAVGNSAWQVHSTGGRQVGAVVLPAGLVIRQFRGDTVIGTIPDGDGFMDIVAIATGIGNSSPVPGADCNNDPMQLDLVRGAMIRTYLRNVVTFADEFRQREGRYPARVSELPRRAAPEGTSYDLPIADAESWVVVLRDDASGYHCLMSRGPRGVPGAVDRMLCSARTN